MDKRIQCFSSKETFANIHQRLKALRALCRHCFTKFVKSVLTPQLALFRVWESECEQPLSVMAVLLQTILMGQIKMNALGYAFPSDKSHTACWVKSPNENCWLSGASKLSLVWYLKMCTSNTEEVHMARYHQEWVEMYVSLRQKVY